MAIRQYQAITASVSSSGQPARDQFREIRDRKVWVHCALNMRVSVFLYLYHVHVAGWQEQEARALLDRIWEPNETWRTFMGEIAKGYGKS